MYAILMECGEKDLMVKVVLFKNIEIFLNSESLLRSIKGNQRYT